MNTATPTPKYRNAKVGGCLQAVAEKRPDGSTVLRSTEALQPYPARLTDRLEHWATTTPDQVFVARREPDGAWITITYAQMLDRVQRLGQALATRGLSAERPIAILSDNDLEHLTLALAAQWIGVPYAPISPAYSTVSQDGAKLRQILATLQPGLVFAGDGGVYGRAIAACVDAEAELLLVRGAVPGRTHTDFQALLATPPGAEVAAAHAQVGPDTIAKFLFTSGSTKQPKGVINTQRMLCANLQQIGQTFAFFADVPPVLVDWLPWNHTFGGNHNVGIVLYNGGTLYLDDGKPTPKGMAMTLQNLREIAPTIYFNVPKGFEEIARAMDHDTVLRDKLFSRVQAFMFAGAGLSQAVWDHLDRHGEQTVGERICIFTGLGMTETAPSCTFAVGTQVKSGDIGLPVPGVEVKLVPNAEGSGKMEIRFRGPNVMPGYWRMPEETAAAFDEEGFYRTGDAVVFKDPADPAKGLRFDGRIAEDFKLATGTFVSVGPMRAKVILAGDPLVQDAVVAGLNRDDVGLLIFPRVEDARRRFGLPADWPAAQVLAAAPVREFFQALMDKLWAEGTGSASRPAAALLLAEPPSIDRGEVTDKGSINQRAVL
ncbi:MAG: feruloyl-CoA synthase, partial [Rubrivivax sp.]|nr:feruloyl-CoA synthase [Rubrivivax sp.]